MSGDLNEIYARQTWYDVVVCMPSIDFELSTGTQNTVKCVMFPSAGSRARIVSVPPLSGLNAAETHHDLDVFMWLPGVPFCSDHVSDTASCRQGVVYKNKGGDVIRRYTVIHFKQSEHKNPGRVESNLLIESLLSTECDGEIRQIAWQYDVLVVRHSADETVLLDATDEDIMLLLELLPRVIMSGRVA
ncbi:hypothetical protein CPC08DRAFT_769428 [Agrocybe pediades]|nr:hypothetical protein CPC08DRAFT_769428 [Agrocybe pediades]